MLADRDGEKPSVALGPTPTVVSLSPSLARARSLALRMSDARPSPLSASFHARPPLSLSVRETVAVLLSLGPHNLRGSETPRRRQGRSILGELAQPPHPLSRPVSPLCPPTLRLPPALETARKHGLASWKTGDRSAAGRRSRLSTQHRRRFGPYTRVGSNRQLCWRSQNNGADTPTISGYLNGRFRTVILAGPNLKCANVFRRPPTSPLPSEDQRKATFLQPAYYSTVQTTDSK